MSARGTSANFISKVLKHRNAIMLNSKEVEVKLQELIKDGIEKLQVITDFDGTLTKSHVNGEPTSHSIDILNNVPTLSKEFLSGCGQLFRKYNDRAYSSELSEGEKQEVLNQWWAGYVELLSKERVTLEDVMISTDKINTPLRDGCEDMLTLLNEHRVPVVVLSAGIGDVITHVLQDYQPKVLANFLQLKENSNLISGFKEPHVSVYNKHKLALPVDPSRHNVIVMGDSLGDYNMADNVPDVKTVLKIGFSSQKDEATLEKFRNRYDIVLIEDQTMNVPNDLFKQVLENSHL